MPAARMPLSDVLAKPSPSSAQSCRGGSHSVHLQWSILTVGPSSPDWICVECLLVGPS